MRCTAIVLAAGRGSRMGSDTPKQYLLLDGKPLFTFSLETMEKSRVLTDVVLVVPEEDIEFVAQLLGNNGQNFGQETALRERIQQEVQQKAQHSSEGAFYVSGAGNNNRCQIEKDNLIHENGQYGPFHKIRRIVAGGSERYFSVLNGLEAIDWPCDYVFIHDGARPFLDEPTIERLYETVQKTGACVAGMPSKDTVKITDGDGVVESTPNREKVWIVQTPQVFEQGLITRAYREMVEALPELTRRGIRITDDAMVAEYMLHTKVKLVEASYRNIKVTTPEDLVIAEAFSTTAAKNSFS